MMGDAAVSVCRIGEIGVVDLDNPPVNALARSVRAALLEAIDVLDQDSTVRAIVIHGRGRHFIAGADLREFANAPQAPLLNDVLLRLEAMGKPVIAALHGSTLGGGAELALASHYRCATRDLALGFPEHTLGLIPGSGGTVRLPRLIGFERTLELLQAGKAIGIDAALGLGLVDRELADDVRDGAVAYARQILRDEAPIRRTSDRPLAPTTPALFAAARAALTSAARRIPATILLIDALEAASTMPVRPALAVARELFEQCRVSVESRALRHLFFAERGSGTGTRGRVLAAIGIVGAGTMGCGIAISAATAGFHVVLVDSQPAAVDAGMQRITKSFDDQVRKGRLAATDGAAAVARLDPSSEFGALANVDLVIEAVFESLELKCEVFRALGTVCRAGAVLATNTSTLDVDAIAAASGRPADVIGMHFFSPANVMRLLEIVRGAATTPEVVATALTAGRRLGKVSIVVGNDFGFVGNRMLYAYGREKELVMLEGADPEVVDRALEAFGMAMGPNAVGDLAGLDVGYSVRKGWVEKPDDPRFYRISDLLVERGRLGQKTGAGFYRYEPGSRRGLPDPEVTALVGTEAARLGITRREISESEIVERCVLALINEGAKVLDDEIAARAADIDAIWCNGYGFPRFRGGPMFYADTLGLPRVLDRVKHYAAMCGERYWQPATSLERLARLGRQFNEPVSASQEDIA